MRETNVKRELWITHYVLRITSHASLPHVAPYGDRAEAVALIKDPEAVGRRALS
jgi:hypothetical protein